MAVWREQATNLFRFACVFFPARGVNAMNRNTQQNDNPTCTPLVVYLRVRLSFRRQVHLRRSRLDGSTGR